MTFRTSFKTSRRLLLAPMVLASVAGGARGAGDDPPPLRLEAVSVTAPARALSTPGLAEDLWERSLTPGGVTVVEGTILGSRNVSSVADMLRYVPGLWVDSTNGDDGVFISSRGSNLDATGFDRNGIKMLQDGLPVTTADGNNHNRIIDPLSTRRAIFARGANGMKYGASTLGGAVDFISPTAHDVPGARLLVNGGSHGQLQGRATVARVFDHGLDGLVTVEGKERDGFRDHNHQQRLGLYANAGWRISEAWDTRFYATYVDNEQELPGSLSRAQLRADRDQARPAALGGDFQLDVETRRIANRTTWVMDARRRLDLGFSMEEQSLFHPIVDKVTVPGVGVVFDGLLIDTDHRDVAFMARYRHQAGDHALLFGLNYAEGRVDGEHFGNDGGRRDGLSTLIDQDASQLEAYAMDRWGLADAWTLVAALQVVRASREIDNTTVATGVVRNPEEDYVAVNPRLGVIHHPAPDIEVFANLSRLYEPPTNFELDDDVRGGDEALDAMHGVVLEVGSRGTRALARRGTWSWDLALYYARVRDEILSVEDPFQTGTSLATNVDRTVHAGLELALEADLALDEGGRHRLAPRLSATVNRFSFDDDPVYDDNDLPAAPEYVVRGELLYRHRNGLYGGPTFDVVGDRYADFANRFKVDDYAIMGLLAGWEGKGFRASVEVENLFDEDYIATHGVRERAAADAEILNPGAPRSVFVGLEWRH